MSREPILKAFSPFFTTYFYGKPFTMISLSPILEKRKIAQLLYLLLSLMSGYGVIANAFQISPSPVSRALFCDDVKQLNQKTSMQKIPENLTSRKLSYGIGDDDNKSLDPKDNSSAVLSYYLLWSPTIFRKTVLMMCMLLAGRFMLGNFLSEPTRRLVDNIYNGHCSNVAQYRFVHLIVLPFLSSACCGVQLLINAMVGAGGCAGFNKHLGPLRPYFLAILLSTIFSQAFTSTANNWNFGNLTLLRMTQLALAFLPELVHVWNTVTRKVLLKTKKESDGFEASNSSNYLYQVEFTIPGMGCVACINKINNALRQNLAVLDSEAWLEDTGGRARIQYKVERKSEAEPMTQSLVQAVQAAGFDLCTSDNLKLTKSLRQEID